VTYCFYTAYRTKLVHMTFDCGCFIITFECVCVCVALETVPLPAEHCPLICHLDESMMQPADNQHRLPAPDVVTDRRRPSVTRSMTSRRATATSGNSVAMAAVTRRHQQQMTSRHASSAMTRKSLQRANRVSEHVSHCSRQRRYNYKLCYSDRQRRAF